MGRSAGQHRAVSQSTATGSIRQGERDQSAAEAKALDAAVFTLSVRRTTGTSPPRCSLEKGGQCNDRRHFGSNETIAYIEPSNSLENEN